MSVASKQLAPNSETYLCSMQGIACGACTVRECFLLGYRVSSCKGYKQGSSWLVMQIYEVIGL
jgi:hypothetical protein